MKPSFFGNKKSLQVVSSSIRNDIKTQIKNLGSFNLNSKYYTFLNKKNVNNLKDNFFLVTLSTFGKKFILYMTIYNSKKYCIFINKKNESMMVSQLNFKDDIFDGTLFDGELVKNNEDKLIYLINDIAYYKGENIITKTFIDRQKIIENIINYEQENRDENLYITNKQYFEYKYIKDLCSNYINHLNYKCSGIYFKNINNYSDNYLFIFPECRSDSKILNNYDKDENLDLFNDAEIIETTKDNTMNLSKQSEDKELFSGEQNSKENTENKELFSETLLKENTIKLSKQSENKELFSGNSVKENSKIHNIKEKQEKQRLEKTTCKFIINTTLMPDIYELYCKNNNNNIEKYSYASVPDMSTSKFIKTLFNDIDYDKNEDINIRINNGKGIYVECNYHKAFKKWIPFKRVDSVDSINTINQIQIILDSL
jgi:hypothetical protein